MDCPSGVATTISHPKNHGACPKEYYMVPEGKAHPPHAPRDSIDWAEFRHVRYKTVVVGDDVALHGILSLLENH
jgi:hypothetical protein